MIIDLIWLFISHSRLLCIEVSLFSPGIAHRHCTVSRRGVSQSICHLWTHSQQTNESIHSARKPITRRRKPQSGDSFKKICISWNKTKTIGQAKGMTLGGNGLNTKWVSLARGTTRKSRRESQENVPGGTLGSCLLVALILFNWSNETTSVLGGTMTSNNALSLVTHTRQLFSSTSASGKGDHAHGKPLSGLHRQVTGITPMTASVSWNGRTLCG